MATKLAHPPLTVLVTAEPISADTLTAKPVIRSPYLFNQLNNTQDKNLFNHVKFHLVRDRIQALAPTNPRVLDIGCGLQVSRRYLNELGLEYQYFGVDYEPEFQPDAVVDLMHVDQAAQLLPWQPDVILLLDVLEHLHEDTAVLDNILSKLAKLCGPSTQLIISLPQMYRLDRFKLAHLHYPEHKIRLTQKEWCQLIGKHFHISSVAGFGYLSVIPYLPMAFKSYKPTNKLGKLFTYLRSKFFEWPPFKPVDLFLSKLIGKLPWVNTWANDILIVATPKSV